MEKIINSGDIEIEKQKFHQHKEPISIQHIDINKMTVSNKVFSDKKGYKYFKKLAKRMLKKIDLYVYLSQKLLHIEKTLMKLNICHF